MVDVAPFSALRYRDLARLDALTAPPYDAIDAVLSRRLRARSQYNVVRLELGAYRPLERESSGRYVAAARTYVRWRTESVLALDAEPALYVYEQIYEHGAVHGRQRGLLAALQLEPWEAGAVLPHEHVFPGPVEDRLRLLEALPVNTSPVYLLAEREPEPVAKLLAMVTQTPPLTAFVDGEEGVHHRLWRVRDRDAHASVRLGFARQRLLMADGHHRYTTALEYRARHPPDREGEGADRILAFVVSGRGPLVRASHRLLRSLPEDFEARLRACGLDRVPVTVRGATPVEAVIAALDEPPPLRHRDQVGDRFNASRPAFGLLTRQGGAVVVIHDAERVAELFGTVPQALRNVDVALLQRVLDVSFGVEESSDQIAFTSDPAAAGEKVTAGHAAGLFLVRPVPLTQIWAVADAGLLLPPKSTSFFPKPRTGLVLRPLSE
ncbi:MAG: DUF1015 domain-containing protein [Actinomycetota bacterium]|nr:DUF1015 domain-containing protein [Actinomycetota bacterium]